MARGWWVALGTLALVAGCSGNGGPGATGAPTSMMTSVAVAPTTAPAPAPPNGEQLPEGLPSPPGAHVARPSRPIEGGGEDHLLLVSTTTFAEVTALYRAAFDADVWTGVEVVERGDETTFRAARPGVDVTVFVRDIAAQSDSSASVQVIAIRQPTR